MSVYGRNTFTTELSELDPSGRGCPSLQNLIGEGGLRDSLLCVSPTAVTHHSFGRVELNVVHSATGGMNPTSCEALFNDLKGHI